jgi:hypothetical protein
MTKLAWVFLALAASVLPLRAETVDLELVLLADASGSIDDTEIAFQREGYARALTDPSILSAITGGMEQKIAVTYVEWGSVSSQDVVVSWRVIANENDAKAFADALIAAPRRAQGRNAIGNALAIGQALIDDNKIEGTRKVIDFSADSAYSWGGVPVELARMNALAAGITINGLAILCRDCLTGRYDLEKAFAETIIGGPGSFVVTAETRPSFADAVRRKLLLEIAGLPARPIERVSSGPPLPESIRGTHAPSAHPQSRAATEHNRQIAAAP